MKVAKGLKEGNQHLKGIMESVKVISLPQYLEKTIISCVFEKKYQEEE